MTSALDRAVASTLERSRLTIAAQERRTEDLTRWQRYALNPFALLDDGLIRIVDQETRKVVPLTPYDYQRRLLGEWFDLELLRETGRLRFRNVVAEKSRQMGITWIFAYGAWWAVTYHDAQGVVKARKSSEVDDGGERSTWRSLFGKIRFVHRNLQHPEACGRANLRFVGGVEPKITNLDRPDSFILGEGETADPGRGGTFTFAILDEAAFVWAGEQVHSALDRACPDGRAYVSSANGRGNVHFRISSRPPKGWAKLRIHWSEHPVYSEGLHVAGEDVSCDLCLGNQAGLAWDPEEPSCHRYPGRLVSPWFDRQVAALTDEQVARELEIDYDASISNRIYPETSRERHLAKVELRYQEVGGRLELGWDYGLTTAVVLCQDLPDEYQVLGYLKCRDQVPEKVAERLRALLVQVGVQERHTGPEWTRRMLNVGDPAGEGRTGQTMESFVSQYVKLGFPIRSQVRRTNVTVSAVKRLLMGPPVLAKRLRISPANGGEEFLQDLLANAWKTDRVGARLEPPEPLNDEHNHGARAFAYLVTYKFPPPVAEEPQQHDDAPYDRGVIDRGVRYGMTL